MIQLEVLLLNAPDQTDRETWRNMAQKLSIIVQDLVKEMSKEIGGCSKSVRCRRLRISDSEFELLFGILQDRLQEMAKDIMSRSMGRKYKGIVLDQECMYFERDRSMDNGLLRI